MQYRFVQVPTFICSFVCLCRLLTGHPGHQFERPEHPEGPQRGEVHRALALVPGRHHVGQEPGQEYVKLHPFKNGSFKL